MQTCEVAVVGLGLMGSAALDALLAAGIDALGFDPLGPGAVQGSSHGSCRVFRRFNFENDNYTNLSDEALEGWMRLEATSGRKILIPCPVLEAGRPGSPMVAASRAATIAKGHADPACTVAEANSKFPAFALPPDWDVVVQDGGAILLSEVALSVMRARAGARVIAEPANIDFRSDCVLIRTPDREVLAQRVILALGPWIGRALPRIAPLLRLTRQAVGWFKPAKPASVALGRFPLFILDRGPTTSSTASPISSAAASRPRLTIMAPWSTPMLGGLRQRTPNSRRSAKRSRHSSPERPVPSSSATSVSTRTPCRPIVAPTRARSSSSIDGRTPA